MIRRRGENWQVTVYVGLDPVTGRVMIEDFNGGVGDKGGFGYDTNGTPDLCSFGYVEIESDRIESAPEKGIEEVTGGRVPCAERRFDQDTHAVGAEVHNGDGRLAPSVRIRACSAVSRLRSFHSPLRGLDTACARS